MSSAKTILVVDDNIVNRKMLKKILSEDYSVVLASNGYEALKFVEDEKVQISGIMLDLLMPFMDGYEFLNIITSTPEYSNIPVIVTTASFDRENEIKALEMGAWDFVSKPYDAKIIKFRLKNAIDRSQLSALKKVKISC